MLTRYRETLRVWSAPIGLALSRLHLRPNQLTLLGLGVSVAAAAAFGTGRVRTAGLLLLVAGLCDFFDGSLARVSGQVTPFGAFLDSVIDRYSDLVILLGILIYFARLSHPRGAWITMAGLVGTIMVSYTKARAESIGVACTIGLMERPERMICLIVGAVCDLLEPALWILAIGANLTAWHRIGYTWRATRDALSIRALVAAGLVLAPAAAMAASSPGSETVAAWTRAVSAYQQGDVLPLIREFSDHGVLDGPIGDYVGYLLAEALSRRGDLVRARAVAAGVADRYRESRLAPEALLLAATLASQSGDESSAQAFLARIVDGYPDSGQLPLALYLLAMSAEARGQIDVAAAAHRELGLRAPGSEYASGAADRLVALAAQGARAPELSLTERIDRAERLLRGGLSQEAMDEAKPLESLAREPSAALRVLRVLAEAAQRLGHSDTAAQAMERAVAQASPDKRVALELEQGRFLLRAGRRDRALTVLSQVVGHGADAEAAEAGYLKGRVLEDLGRTADATMVYRTVAARHSARDVAGLSLWRLGWLAYMRRDFRVATDQWTRLVDLPGGRAYRIAALYWIGRSQELTGGRAVAEPFYARVLAESPRSYYGVLAGRRAATPKATDAEPPIQLPEDPETAMAADPAFGRVGLLRQIGLSEFAWHELEDVAQRSTTNPERLYAVSGQYIRGERYHMALRILRRHFAPLAATGHPKLPPALWEMLYPFGWRGQVMTAAARAGLDPYLIAAVVREESSYNPRAVSRAGARGLMQLLPATARLVAGQHGLRFDGDAGLDDPDVNLQLGSNLLAELITDFGDPRLALAAYNAGPRRLRQWWRSRQTDDLEAFVEQIPFDETRHYVKRVVLSWDEYRRVYAAAR